MEIIHYEYSTPTYNGLYSVGTTVAFCDARGVTVTYRRADVTCDECLATLR